MHKKILSMILVAALGIGVLSGCGQTPSESNNSSGNSSSSGTEAEQPETAGSSGSGNKITLRFAADTAEDTEYGKEFFPLLEKFQEENPDIVIEYELAIDADMKTKIKTEAAAEMLPDVFWYWSTYSNSQFLYESGVIVPLDDIIAESSVLNKEMFPQSILDAITYDGVELGIPLDSSRGFFIVNKTLYDEYGVPLPKTYEEFREGGKVFLENGIIPLSVGFKDGNPGHQWLSILLNQLPGGSEEINALLDGANLSTDSGNLARVARIIQEDADMGMYPKDFINGDWNTQQALFFEGKAAAMYSLSFQLQSCPAEMVENCMMWSVPQLEDAVNDPSTYYFTGAQDSIMVSKKSFEESEEKKDAIMRFIDWYYSAEHINVVAKYKELAFNYPIDTEQLPPLVQEMYVYQEGMGTVSSIFTTVQDSTLFNDFKNALQEVAAKITTPEEFAEKVKQMFDEY